MQDKTGNSFRYTKIGRRLLEPKNAPSLFGTQVRDELSLRGFRVRSMCLLSFGSLGEVCVTLLIVFAFSTLLLRSASLSRACKTLVRFRRKHTGEIDLELGTNLP